MGWKSTLVQPYASWVAKGVTKMAHQAIDDQRKIFKDLILKGKATKFGKNHDFVHISNHKDFTQKVPLRDYEALRPYIDLILKGMSDVLWPGKPKYLAKTSGTTSGVKYIPLTKDSIPNHLFSAQRATLNYLAHNPNNKVFDGKVIFLSGSPELSYNYAIPAGRLSGIVNHEVPSWIRGNQLPSYPTNCIDDWEEKLNAVVKETLPADMRLISGIPPWVQMYYERLLDATGKTHVKEIFPNFNLFIFGGVNYEPYRATIEKLIGESIPSIELFPASEGFIAFQSDQGDSGLLLITDSGVFYEFIPLEEVHQDQPTRLTLEQVEIGKDYALIINNNAGLWGYNIGDCVRFTSLDPYKLIVSGRVKHFISAFGEHVIGKEVEQAMKEACQKHHAEIVEFTVAPQVSPVSGLPYHEWFVEFSKNPAHLDVFIQDLDASLSSQNIYYQDLIEGKILRPLVLTQLQRDAFRSYMNEAGKLGGQNKVPRLSNDRKIASALAKFIIESYK